MAGPVIIASGVITYIVGFGLEVRAVFSLAVGLLLGVAAYSSVFTWTGLVTGRALAVALLYVILWEGVTGSLISGVGYLSIRGYTLAVMHGLDSTAYDTLDGSVIGFSAALTGAVLVAVAFYGLGVWRLTRMDIP